VSTSADFSTSGSRIRQRKRQLADIRDEIRRRRESGETGISSARVLSDRIDKFVCDSFDWILQQAEPAVLESFALVAVGGNGRRRPAPYSDVDLLIVLSPQPHPETEALMQDAIRDCWDSGIEPGVSTRTPENVATFAFEDLRFATSLIDARHLMGSQALFDDSQRLLQKKVFGRDSAERIRQLTVHRRDEWITRGNSVNQLEPDVKRSPGGLRDLQLLRWVAFLRYGKSAPDILVAEGIITEIELQQLHQADEYLTALRLDLHLHNSLKQDVLTRDLQLQLSALKGITGSNPSRPVEVFMQQYFTHTSQIAAIARRVSDVPKKQSLLQRVRNRLLPRRSESGYLIVNGSLQLEDAVAGKSLTADNILEIFLAAAENRVQLAPELRLQIQSLRHTLPEEPTRHQTDLFRQILRSEEGLPTTLRAMAETEFLDWLIPPFAEIRNLMQFNQYHSFTVDEHTLKTIDEVAQFADDKSPVGSAYRETRHRATLHLSLILHDIGKGRAGDHSIIGEEIAESVAVRLQLATNKKNMLKFLVRQHLVMPDLAFRRDITDRDMLMEFAKLVGAPELLRMLYCLSVADIRAVGPDVWSDWKGDLLADLYDRTSLILSGRPFNHLERERIGKVRNAVLQLLNQSQDSDYHSSEEWSRWTDEQLDSLPALYLMNESPDRIARDLDVIRHLSDSDVRIEGQFDPEKSLVSYRVFISPRLATGSFHMIAGLLSGMGMDIQGALICNAHDGVRLLSFEVEDRDFAIPVPDARIEDVSLVIGDVLSARRKPETVFRRSSIFRGRKAAPILDREPKVQFDNDCSQRFTVIDVFATDTQGLLYTLAHTINSHDLAICLARIDTSVDQVVDVFYVQDRNGKKLEDPAAIERLRAALLEEIRNIGST
jgi:[protein-PII] uridylyltransferase